MTVAAFRAGHQNPHLLTQVLTLQGSTGSESSPLGHSTLEAIDTAVQTVEHLPITGSAELQPGVPAHTDHVNSHAAEAATTLNIPGITLYSVPILSPPLQHDSAPSAPSVSDEEPSGAEVNPPQRLVDEPGAARSSSVSLHGSLTMQPNSVSTPMQQASSPDATNTLPASPTQQPRGITLKVCIVHHSGLPWHLPECCFQRQCTNNQLHAHFTVNLCSSPVYMVQPLICVAPGLSTGDVMQHFQWPYLTAMCY